MCIRDRDERADERRGFDGGAPARRSRDGDGKIAAPVGPVSYTHLDVYKRQAGAVATVGKSFERFELEEVFVDEAEAEAD